MTDSWKKRKQHYTSYNNKKHKSVPEPGLKGFLCSCNGNEKQCVRESYNLLNKFADILYKPKDLVEEDQADVEDELSSEIKNLKKEYRFNLLESGARNLLFIKANIDDPIELATMIVKDVFDNNKAQTRYLVRLVPIQQTCKAHLDDIKKCCKELLECNLLPNKTFSIIYNHRNNNNLKRDEIINEVADIAHSISGDNKVNLSAPDVCILIEVIKNIAYISVIPDYVKYKKFNLLINATDSETKNVKDDALASDAALEPEDKDNK